MHVGQMPVKDRKARFALVGCGRISKNHIHSINVHAERWSSATSTPRRCAMLWRPLVRGGMRIWTARCAQHGRLP